jgi:hypothetical protein
VTDEPTCEGYVSTDSVDRFLPPPKSTARTCSGALGAVEYAYVEDDTQLILYRLGYVDGVRVDGARLDSDGVWRPSTAAVMVFAGDTSTMSPIKEPRAAEVAALLGGSLDSPTVAA